MSLLEKDKRKFSVIIGSKKCGACSGASPSGAARKVKGKSGAFYLKETTKDSKKKLYGPYSSKKKIVQRGGEENTLRQEICNTVLQILRKCDKPDQFDNEMNVAYKILENIYLFLGIKDIKMRCSILKDIMRMRDIYEVPLCDSLCSLDEKASNMTESEFCTSNKGFLESKIMISTGFYKHWSNVIKFLRITIQTIERKRKIILNRNRESNERLEHIKKNYFLEKDAAEIDKMQSELKEAQEAFNKAALAKGGPAKQDGQQNNSYATAGPAQELNSNNRRSRGFARGRADSGPNKPLPSYALTNNELAEIGQRPNGSSLTSHKPLPSYALTNNELREIGINPNRNSVVNQIPQSMLQQVRRKKNMSNLIARLKALEKD